MCTVIILKEYKLFTSDDGSLSISVSNKFHDWICAYLRKGTMNLLKYEYIISDASRGRWKNKRKKIVSQCLIIMCMCQVFIYDK